jgi:hypothetical protein
VGTLIVAVLDQRHQRVGRPRGMIFVANGFN